ncbi:hypothetical protein PybrP1_004341 [[Pythium] brassicae (nom. inval.)]|nr:hypothetical protein PybrP1_004341 [[Pythium] brassicae (nom. inval.)]
MENYESLGTIGEGTYGVVLKCRHKTTGQIVAIKKFKESDDDEQVKKTALREIKVLKALRHANIVSLLEVFRVKGKLYLVFEFVEKTILEEIEKNPEGLEPAAIKRLIEVESLRARFPQLDKFSLDFMHQTIQDEPLDRWTCAELLKHPFFENQGDVFEAELQDAIAKDLTDSVAIRKKRSRKPPPSRGAGDPAASPSGLSSFLSPSTSTKSSTPYDDQQPQAKNALKPTFKPMIATPLQAPIGGGGSKDKAGSNTYVMASTAKKGVSNGSVQGGSSSNGALGGGTGAYHLPTLHGATTSSSSSSSSGNVAGASSGDTSPYGFSKKLGGGVPPIAENQPVASGVGSLGLPVPAEHLDFVNQHAHGRQSMTSHGGGRSTPASSSTALVYPYSIGGSGAMATNGGGGGAPPKPPPTSSYMRNPYLATPAPASNAHKRTTNGSHKNTTTRHGGGTLESTNSPKKYTSSSSPGTMNGQHYAKKATVVTVAAGTGGGGLGMAMAMDLTPQGIYVPPRTSHSTLRDGGKANGRRDHDSGRSF